MIKIKELECKSHIGKSCVGFIYNLKNEKGETVMTARYSRCSGETSVWVMSIIFERTRDADSQVYSFEYMMPRNNLPLELIAATGLKYFKEHLVQEAQRKMDLVFGLSDVLEGM